MRHETRDDYIMNKAEGYYVGQVLQSIDDEKWIIIDGFSSDGLRIAYTVQMIEGDELHFATSTSRFARLVKNNEQP